MDVPRGNSVADEIILQRTTAGERALLFESLPEGSPEWRLLAMATGFTPLHFLVDLGLDEAVTRTAAQRLMVMELAASAAAA